LPVVKISATKFDKQMIWGRLLNQSWKFNYEVKCYKMTTTDLAHILPLMPAWINRWDFAGFIPFFNLFNG
jgi:hypothetical protein